MTISCDLHVYAVSQYAELMSADDSSLHTFVGLEPLDPLYRTLRYQCFTVQSKQRFAIMIDSGAPDNCAGASWIDRFVKEYNTADLMSWEPFHSRLSGIGSGSATVRYKNLVPIGIPLDSSDKFLEAKWCCQRLEGIGVNVPPLWGLGPLEARGALIDLRNKNRPVLSLRKDGASDNDRYNLPVIKQQGHLFVPVDWGGRDVPDRDSFINDPLGVAVWMTSTASNSLEQHESSQSNAVVPNVAEPATNVTPAASATSEAFPSFRRVDKGAECFRTSLQGGPAWSQVRRRITRDVHTNEVLGDETCSEMPPEYNWRKPFGAVRDIETVLFFEPNNLEATALPTIDSASHALAESLMLELPPGLDVGSSLRKAHSPHEYLPSTTKSFPASSSRESPKKNFGEGSQKFVRFSPKTIVGDPRINIPTPKSAAVKRPSPVLNPSSMYGAVKLLRNQARDIVRKYCKLTDKQIRLMEHSKTYREKYKPLPPDTPVPDTSSLPKGQWDFWEWWGGTGKLTAMCRKEELKCGPVVTHATGWCLSIPTHRQRLLELLSIHQPKLLFGAPVCGPWSQSSTTMDPELKEAIRIEQAFIFEFFCTACKIQTRSGRFYLYEQPKSSELLHTDQAADLAKSTSSRDLNLCMCMHDLQCPVTKLPHMKPTTLRGTLDLSGSRLDLWCDKSHKHQPLQGKLPGGKLRTACAQDYTTCFCKRAARDFKTRINSQVSYPAFDDEGDEEAKAPDDSNPLQTLMDKWDKEEPDLEVKPLPVPVPKASPKPEPFRGIGGSSSSRAVASDSATQEVEVPPIVKAPKKSKKAPEPLTTDIIPFAPGELAAIPEDLPAPGNSRDVKEDDAKALNHLISALSSRIAPGGSITIQTGPRLKLLQEMFCQPHGKQCIAAQICRKPKCTMPPEPLVSRESAPLLFELVQQKGTEWKYFPWKPYDTQIYSKPPNWTVVLHARDNPSADTIALNPWQELAQLQEDASKIQTLNQFLRALADGDTATREALILALHRRLYHRPAPELRKIMHKAGVPMSVLSLVDDVCSKCETCRNFNGPHAKPLVKIGVNNRFNGCVYVDLVFFDKCIVFVGMDESIRWTVLKVVEYRDHGSLETAFRRAWVSQYGPPSVVRSDREGVFASERFGIYLAMIGCQLELVTAKDQHSWLGILDNRVKILRRMFPRLMQDLSDISLNVDYEDAIAECQIALNTQLHYNGSSSYQCLYGADPTPLFREDDDFIIPGEAHHAFYEHMVVRAKAISVLHQCIIDNQIERANTGRSRNTDLQALYKPGQWVDFWRKTPRKGWKGGEDPQLFLQN